MLFNFTDSQRAKLSGHITYYMTLIHSHCSINSRAHKVEIMTMILQTVTINSLLKLQAGYILTQYFVLSY